MYDLTKLYSAFADFPDVTPENRTARIEMALARQIAYRLPMPSSPIEGLAQYYANSGRPLVVKAVSDLNEQYPINTELTLNLIFELWRQRYYLLHSPSNVEIGALLQCLFNSESYGYTRASIAPRYKDCFGQDLPFVADSLVREFVAEAVPMAADPADVISG